MKTKTKNLSIVIAVAVVLSLAAIQPCIAVVPDPTPTDLGALYGHNFSEAYAINNDGQVVGESYEGDTPYSQPFIWQNEVMDKLPLPLGFYEGVAMSINDAGQVAGYCKDANSLYQACLWTRGAGGWVVTALGTPTFTLPESPESPEQELTFINSYAVKINNAGQILAMATEIVYEGETYNLTAMAIWQNGVWSFLTDSEGLPQTGWFFKMNENGQVLFKTENSNEQDSDLWVWDGETAIKLVEAVSWANLNNSGQIVGRHFNYTAMRSENFTYDTATKTLQKYPVSDAGYSLVNINNNGQVLVAYETQREYENGYVTAITTELGITSFADWSPGTASVTSLGFLDDYVNHGSLNFNINGEVSGHGSTIGSLFYASEGAGVIQLNGFVQNDWYLDVTAMNDSGVIIGRSYVPDSGAHAVLWGEVAPPVSTLDILIDPSDPVPVDTTISSTATFNDAPDAGPHTAFWDWEDGEPSKGDVDEASQTVTGSHKFVQPGVYTVGLTVSSAEGSDYAIYQYVVVYDPAAGFVTGGGWFNSPAGAYTDTSLVGKATFGFVSKYDKKGATVPTGNTDFRFETGDLYFHSTSYDWLVVTGGNYAKFMGSGIINGGGDCKFMVWAGDGEPDTFRIRIWKEDEDTGAEIDIYDNGFDQAIGGGSIVIHTKEK